MGRMGLVSPDAPNLALDPIAIVVLASYKSSALGVSGFFRLL